MARRSSPTWAVAELGSGDTPWQFLVRIEATGIDPDARATRSKAGRRRRISGSNGCCAKRASLPAAYY